MGCCGSKVPPPIPTPEPQEDKIPAPAASPEIVEMPPSTAVPTENDPPSPVSNVNQEPVEVKAHSGDEDSESSAPSLNDQRSEFMQRMERKREEVEAQKRRLTASTVQTEL